MRFPFSRTVWAAALLSLTTCAFATEPPKHWPQNAFTSVTEARLQTLPEGEREAWASYVRRSEEMAKTVVGSAAPEFSPSAPVAGPIVGAAHSKGLQLNADAKWYGSEEAARIADRVAGAQARTGGWTKGGDYTRDDVLSAHQRNDVWSRGTLDNDATVAELRFLALCCQASAGRDGSFVWRSAFLRGVEYLLASQYPNGGFPQIYPLVGGYHDAITYNDGAMVQALELLRDVSEARPPFTFVPGQVRTQCANAVAAGVACILNTQVRTAAGKLTAWGQQHDAFTLSPCAARNFEPIALSSAESASLVKFLMEVRRTPEVTAAVDAAISWFKQVALHDVAWRRDSGESGLFESPGAVVWSRLYEIESGRPIFGDRDRTIHFSVTEISPERRNGYAWYGTWPKNVLAKYGAWSEQ
jgi:PelA/Pel-15E family pectate lyase